MPVDSNTALRLINKHCATMNYLSVSKYWFYFPDIMENLDTVIITSKKKQNKQKYFVLQSSNKLIVKWV